MSGKVTGLQVKAADYQACMDDGATGLHRPQIRRGSVLMQRIGLQPLRDRRKQLLFQ
jgi:hypothetical protein